MNALNYHISRLLERLNGIAVYSCAYYGGIFSPFQLFPYYGTFFAMFNLIYVSFGTLVCNKIEEKKKKKKKYTCHLRKYYNWFKHKILRSC